MENKQHVLYHFYGTGGDVMLGWQAETLIPEATLAAAPDDNRLGPVFQRHVPETKHFQWAIILGQPFVSPLGGWWGYFRLYDARWHKPPAQCLPVLL